MQTQKTIAGLIEFTPQEMEAMRAMETKHTREKLLRDFGAMVVGQLNHPALCGATPFELLKDDKGYAYQGISGYRVAQLRLNVGLRNAELAAALTPDKLAFFVPWETDTPPAAYIDPAAMKFVTIEAPFPVELQKTKVSLDSIGQFPDDGQHFIAGPDMRGRTVTVPFADMVHVLGAGTTGSGKSTFLQSAAYQTSLANPPGAPAQNVIVLVTGKMSAAFSSINGLPGQMGPLAADEQAVINALGWVITEMNRRYDVLEKSGALITTPGVNVFFDEFQEMTEDGRNALVTEMVRQIAVKGRECGIRLWATTHKPNLRMFGKSGNAVKGQFSTIVGLRMTDPVSSRVLRNDDTCTYLRGRGDARVLAEVDGVVLDSRVQMAYIPDFQLAHRAGGKPALECWPAFEDRAMEKTFNRGRPADGFTDEQLACAIHAGSQDPPLGRDALRSILQREGAEIGGNTKIDKLLKKGRRIAEFIAELQDL